MFDPLAAVAALSVMATVVVAMFAFYGNAMPASSSAVRGRLQGLMSGTSVVETGPVALRGTNTGKGVFSKMAQGDLGDRLAAQLERADMTLSPGEFIVGRFALAFAGLIAPILFLSGGMAYLAGAVAAV